MVISRVRYPTPASSVDKELRVHVTALYTERITTRWNTSDLQKEGSNIGKKNCPSENLYTSVQPPAAKFEENNFKLAKIILSSFFHYPYLILPSSRLVL